MRRKYWLLGLCAVAGSGLAILGGGCGILTAPVSVPTAVTENANFSFKGTVVDVDGRALDGVVMAQNLEHRFWTPLAGGRETDEDKLRRVDGTFGVSERGARLTVKFSREGFHDAEYSFSAIDDKIVTTPEGAWRNQAKFPVVLYSKSVKDALLASWRGDIDFTGYPKGWGLDLERLAERSAVVLEPTNEVAPARAGVFYVTLVKGGTPAGNSRGDIAPVDVNLPEQITLHISGEDGGFVRIEPRVGYGPMQVSDTAPESGYQRTLAIDRGRLRAMRLARADLVIEAHEYFYFRANGRYGKGWIAWSQTFAGDEKNPLPTSFRFAVYEAREPGDRNLASPTTGSN